MDPGHVEVEQQEVRTEGVEHAKGVLTIGGGAHFGPEAVSEDLGHEVSQRGLVLSDNDQEPHRSHPTSAASSRPEERPVADAYQHRTPAAENDSHHVGPPAGEP
jgi:hypothetical protein